MFRICFYKIYNIQIFEKKKKKIRIYFLKFLNFAAKINR